jgi:hypothetical protein
MRKQITLSDIKEISTFSQSEWYNELYSLVQEFGGEGEPKIMSYPHIT